MKVKVKSVRNDKTQACLVDGDHLEGVWKPVAEHVQKYIKSSEEAEVTIKEGVITFFKQLKSANTASFKPANEVPQEKTHWITKHIVRSGLNDMELQTLLNDIASDNFVFASIPRSCDTGLLNQDGSKIYRWVVVIYIKIKPEEDINKNSYY